jgi:predicted NUDIX family phosphoesterase
MEQVLVFQKKLLENLTFKFCYKDNNSILNFFDNILPTAFFMDREKAEKDEDYLQIIPYVVFVNEDKILSYQRSKASGETRLHDKTSIGIGGHINPIDFKDQDSRYVIFNCAKREINEEVILQQEFHYKGETIGLLYDPSNSVGRVHFGVVLQIEIDFLPRARAEELKNISWKTKEELLKEPNLENWSKVVLDKI